MTPVLTKLTRARYSVNRHTVRALNGGPLHWSRQEQNADWTQETNECGSCSTDGCTCTEINSCGCGGGCSIAF